MDDVARKAADAKPGAGADRQNRPKRRSSYRLHRVSAYCRQAKPILLELRYSPNFIQEDYDIRKRGRFGPTSAEKKKNEPNLFFLSE